MQIRNIDWRVLRGASVLSAVTLIVCVCLVSASQYFYSRMERAYFDQKKQLVAVRSQYRALDDSRRDLELYLPQYRLLEESGIVGPERRLDWIETVRGVARQTRLPSFRYQISAQEPYDVDVREHAGAYRAYASEMQVELGLLHEVDLLSVLAELEARATGLFRVEECRIRRTAKSIGRDPTRSNLIASCGIDWLTVRQDAEEAT